MALRKLQTAPKPATPSELNEICDEIETAIADLRVKYEQYFLGIERTAPIKEHEALKKRVVTLKESHIRQTAIRFRIQTLAARLVTHEQMWVRTMKEIEDGTYRRELYRARRRTARGPTGKPAAEELDVSDWDEPERPPPPPPPASESKMRGLYDAYVQAKQRCGEDTSSLTFETVASTLKVHVPAIMKAHNARSVEFKVVIKDGKAFLRAIPKL